ncbi:hypothetical protein BKA70DRAFT_1023275, partial [Coprinopsis sp. MPI-PUGE-AT-0042]
WHPKLTGSRLFVIITTLALGTAKAVTANHGDAHIPVTIEWFTSIVVFVIFLIVDSIEARANPRPRWFFQRDALNLLWRLRKVCFSMGPPKYETEELDRNPLVKPRHPPITGYRLLVSCCIIILGLSKAILTYQGKSTEPSMIEWFCGVYLSLLFYCLGLYEGSSTRVMPCLFEKNY